MKNILLIISIGLFLSCDKYLNDFFTRRTGACVFMKTLDVDDNKYYYSCYGNETQNECGELYEEPYKNSAYPDANGLATKEWLEDVSCSDFCNRDSVLTNSAEGSSVGGYANPNFISTNGCCPISISETQAYPDLTCYIYYP